MTTESNKTLCRAYLDAAGRGDLDGVAALTTEDFVYELMGSVSIAGRRERAEVLELIGGLGTVTVSGIEFTVDEMVAEGDRVAAVVFGRCALRNGERYDGTYQMMFHLRDGLVAALRELADTKLTEETLVAAGG